MRSCCDVIKDLPGVGAACSDKMLNGVEKPETCLFVLQGVDAMFEARNQPLPDACQVPTTPASTTEPSNQTSSKTGNAPPSETPQPDSHKSKETEDTKQAQEIQEIKAAPTNTTNK